MKQSFGNDNDQNVPREWLCKLLKKQSDVTFVSDMQRK